MLRRTAQDKEDEEGEASLTCAGFEAFGIKPLVAAVALKGWSVTPVVFSFLFFFSVFFWVNYSYYFIFIIVCILTNSLKLNYSVSKLT